MKKTAGERIFHLFNVMIMLLITASILFPVLNVISISFSDRAAILNKEVSFYPKGWETGAYREVLVNKAFLRSLVNTVGITITGTLCAVLVTLLTSYALTKEFPGKSWIKYYFVITMYFGGGLIPTYIILSNILHLRNTYWVLFLPSLVSFFYIIVMRSQIETVPPAIMEAAFIDGAGEFQTVFRIVLPMITATIAAIAMFFALGFWNAWFSVMVYEDTEKHWMLQYFLRVVVFDKFIAQYKSSDLTVDMQEAIPEENYRAAAVVLVAAPIVAIYPFVQKYFVKGIISGAVKG